MFRLIPSDTGFFDQFDRSVAVLVEAAVTYAALVREPQNRGRHYQRLREIEHDGDELLRETKQRLGRVFLTPIDREDIQALTFRLDDAIDDIDAAGQAVELYEIRHEIPHLSQLCQILEQAARTTQRCVSSLRNLKKAADLPELLESVHRLEKEADSHFQTAMAEMFRTAHDPIDVIKWKDIYTLTERAIDRCEDVADIISGILLKNA